MDMLGIQGAVGAGRRAGPLGCLAALSWFVACGGNAAVDDSSGHAGMNSSAGASNGAGASHSAGTSSSAGAPAGGSAGAACTAPQDAGPCEGFFPAFWHDPQTGLCEPFVYGGCSGNENRYPSRDACMQACAATRDDWGGCAHDNDCVLAGPSCCVACDPAIEQLVAVNLAHEQQYRELRCPGPGTSCEPCIPVPENEQTSKFLKAVCENARCTVLDIRESPLTECQKTSDCVLRDGAGCCAECDGSGWVPVNKNADLCGGAPAECDDCTSPLPANWDVVCLSGRCLLVGPI